MNLLKTTKGKWATVAAGTVVVAAVVVGILLTKEESFRTVAVEELNGTTIVTSEGKDAAEAYEGMHLYSGDDVEVQPASDMTMVLDMDKYVYAEPGTHFWLECAGSAEQSETMIHLAEGSVLNRLKDTLNAGEVYQVDTPNSTMAVRGTVFRVTVYRGEDGLVYTDLEVFEGQVQVDLKTEDGEYNGVSETFGPGERALIRGNSEFSEFVVGEGDIVKLPIAYKDIPQETAKQLVFYIQDGEILCIEEELLKDYTALEEHKMERVAGQDATCTEDGYEEVICTVCKEVTDTVVLPALGHVSDEWIVDAEATCVQAGHHHKVCSVCQEVFADEDIEALGHISSSPVITAVATCTTPGLQTMTCERCGEYLENVEIPALGHTPGAWQKVSDASCSEAGSQKRVCSVCGDTVETSTIAALGHKWGSWQTERDATCNSNGEDYKTCSVCGKSQTRTVMAGGHSWGEYVVTDPGDCTNDGTQTRTCDDCGATESQTIAASGEHRVTQGEEIPATCETDGSMTGTCDICGAENVTMTIPKLGHNWGQWVTDEPATCEEDGVKIRTCQNEVCDIGRETQVIPALGHDVSATHYYPYTSSGFIYITCAMNCSRNETAPCGYVPPEPVTVTCSETDTPGEIRCTNCGELIDPDTFPE